MPLINEELKFKAESSQQAQNAFNQTQPQGLFQIPEKFLQLIPWIPIGLEMLTGQKIPATGVLADILNGIQQLQLSVNQVLTNQSQLWSKLENLESNASNQLSNLNQQVKDFRLLATEKQSFVGDQTKRSLEFKPKLAEE